MKCDLMKNDPKYFLIVTLNHKNISLQQLPQFTIPCEAIEPLLLKLAGNSSITEIVSLCTCNRTEFFATVESVKDAAHVIAEELSAITGISLEELRPTLDVIVDAEAVEHLFNLVSGLESMVVGDAQILGQVKAAYNQSNRLGITNKSLHTLFQKAFSIAKRVRNETGLGKGRLSISALAVESALEEVGSLHSSVVSVLGAGKMGALAARYLKKAGVKELRIANRSPEKSIALANEVSGIAYGLDELDRILVESDIVICATASQEPQITKAMMEFATQSQAKQRILIDIALPPDVDEAVKEVEGVTLINLEALRQQAQQNQEQRSEQYERAKEIVDEELDRIGPWPMPLHIDSLAAQLGRYADEIYKSELESLFEALPDLTSRQKEVIESKMKRISDRIILMPRRNLRQSQATRSCPNAYTCLSELFDLETGARSNPLVESTNPMKD